MKVRFTIFLSALFAMLSVSADDVAVSFAPKMPGRVRFALCQTPCGTSSGTDQIAETVGWVRGALHGDEDVIVFPELSFSSFSELETAWTNAATVWSATASFAMERNAWVIAHHPTRPEGAANSYGETRVFAPDGSVAAIYRKRILARMDIAAGFEAGPPAAPAELPFARVGILVCKDAFYPQAESDGYESVDVLLAQFAHPGIEDQSDPEAKYFPQPDEAAEDLRGTRKSWCRPGRSLLAVNKTGRDGLYTLCGGTFAAAETGSIVAGADDEATLVFVDFPLGPNGRIKPVPSFGGISCPHSAVHAPDSPAAP